MTRLKLEVKVALTSLLFAILAAARIVGQAPTPVPTPAAAPSVPAPKLSQAAKVDLLEAQAAVLKLQLQQKSIEDFYRKLQADIDSAKSAFDAKAKAVLAKDGIDAGKWEVNTYTLEIVAKGTSAPNAPAPAPAKP
jgi:hypothetical protein